MTVEGISTNIPLHRKILQDDAFRASGVTIHHLEKQLSQKADR
jgi:acetyl-CoA carboxylase, biotin carboxylase subunit